MAHLSFISLEAAASFVAKPQDLSFVSGTVFEQYGSYKVEVVFDGLTTAEQLDDMIFPEGMVQQW